MKVVCPSVCAVVVSYHPQQERLLKLLTCLVPQVGHIVLIDNGSGAETQCQLQKLARLLSFSFLPQPDNGGIAKAQNSGIDLALRQGFEYVLLMDQDSLPQADTVAILLDALLSQVRPTAAVGPCYIDQRTGLRSHFVRFQYGMMWRRRVRTDRSLTATDFLIASGMLIPAKVLAHVGKMDEELFIDHVDTEWCLRAAAAGYSLFGVSVAPMLHELGEGSIKFWLFGKRSFPNHKPLRYYYGVRNSLLILRRNYIPAGWRIFLLLRSLAIAIGGLLLLPMRWSRVKMIVRGISDGLADRRGPFIR
jgi:rhamnosyltransferase